MSGPSNAIMGEEDRPTELPQTQVSDEFLNQEKSLAKYSKTKEFQELKAYMEGRIEFFQKHLPGGELVVKENDPVELVHMWKVALIVVAEFQAVLDRYKQAEEVVSGREDS